jgi:hypothetical protein
MNFFLLNGNSHGKASGRITLNQFVLAWNNKKKDTFPWNFLQPENDLLPVEERHIIGIAENRVIRIVIISI